MHVHIYIQLYEFVADESIKVQFSLSLLSRSLPKRYTLSIPDNAIILDLTLY